MTNFLFVPGPDSPIGFNVSIADPDTGRDVDCIIAHDGFEVEVSAEDIETAPGVGLYVPDEDRAIFGFVLGIADIASPESGAVVSEDYIFPTFMSRWEAPLSVLNYDEVHEKTLQNGRLLVQLSQEL